MEKNENGYPTVSQRRGCSGNLTDSAQNGSNNGAGDDLMNGMTECTDCLDDKPLAYSYTPIQRWRMIYPHEMGLQHGTLFEELYKPWGVYGNE